MGEIKTNPAVLRIAEDEWDESIPEGYRLLNCFSGWVYLAPDPEYLAKKMQDEIARRWIG